VLVLWNETSNQLQVVASLGQMFFDEEKINSELPLLLKIILSGQSEILSDLSELYQAGIVLPEVQSILYSALKVNQRVMGAIILASHAADQYTAADLKLLTTLALQASSAIESASLFEKNIREVKDREEALRKVYDATAKFVPVEFIDALGHQLITEVKLGDHVERIVTVLFSDIRDFTGISEKMTPEENFRFVCSFNERMGPIIKNYGGFINQYLGDAIMAIFPGNAANALAAAVDMQKEVAELNVLRSAANQPLIHIGVGMHTGPLIMGITGDNDRMDATTISDTVNTASRIESLTKQYKAGIILSDASLQQIQQKENFKLRQLGSVQLKGKQETVNIHECFSHNAPPYLQLKLETLQDFNDGVNYYLNNSFQQAGNAFAKIIDSHPDDLTAHFFYTNVLQNLEKETTR
jgi:class 3 adenylate cyclase